MSNNKTRYYISSPNSEKGFEEITEAEFLGLIGEGDNRTYATRVYRGTMLIDDVPEENRETVTTIVANKIAKWGGYDEQAITPDELADMIKEAL